jgi:glutathione S-transferase
MAAPSIDEQIAEWRTRAEKFVPANMKELEKPLAELDAHLTLRSHIVGYSLTDADTTVWQNLRNNKVGYQYIKQGLMFNLARWFRYIEEAFPDTTSTLVVRPKVDEAKKKKDSAGGNYEIGLQEAEDGKVVTRFPPEPS